MLSGGNGASHAAISVDGQWLALINSAAIMRQAGLIVLPIGSDGAVTDAVVPESKVVFDQGPFFLTAECSKLSTSRPESVYFAPGSTEFIFVANAGLNAVLVYSFNSATGVLEFAGEWKAPGCTAPTRLAFKGDKM